MNLPVRQSAGYAPLRRPGSVRRTSSIDVSWPDGREGNMRFDARARDVVTSVSGGEMKVLAEDAYVASIRQDRTIDAITALPARANIEQLVGQRGGGHLRGALADLFPEELAAATPLYLILDDISGASLISGWAWSHWSPDWIEQIREARATQQINMEGVCIGFRPGSSALDEVSAEKTQLPAPTPDLRHPDDPEGWHEVTIQDSAGMRRARRIDIWLEGDTLKIDSSFQDSGSTPEGERMVLHEYRLVAEADTGTGLITSIEAIPCVLPFSECHDAPAKLSRLTGKRLGSLRAIVLTELLKTAGCTHLNDALRALAEVPQLSRHL